MRTLVVSLLATLALCLPAAAEEMSDTSLEQARIEAIRWGVQYLRNAQGEDGLFSPIRGLARPSLS